MAGDSLSLKLILTTDLRLLSVARAFMESTCRAARLDEGMTDALVLAVHEAVSNVLRHAHRDCPGAELQLHFHLHDDCVEIQILDQGEPFDLAGVPVLDPAELRIGGRGVFLMRTLMDQLSCQPRGERGNLLRMVKFCRANSRLQGSA